ncbi:MAG: hypothetical protein ABIF12_03725 [bacterium]
MKFYFLKLFVALFCFVSIISLGAMLSDSLKNGSDARFLNKNYSLFLDELKETLGQNYNQEIESFAIEFFQKKINIDKSFYEREFDNDTLSLVIVEFIKDYIGIKESRCCIIF